VTCNDAPQITNYNCRICSCEFMNKVTSGSPMTITSSAGLPEVQECCCDASLANVAIRTRIGSMRPTPSREPATGRVRWLFGGCGQDPGNARRHTDGADAVGKGNGGGDCDEECLEGDPGSPADLDLDLDFGVA
jgi:hypothetical protein